MNIEEILHREGLSIASMDKRILAFVIDDIVVSMIFFLAFSNQLSNLGSDVNAILAYTLNILNILPYFAIIAICYHAFFTYAYGASIGKIICKIKIIRIDTLDKPNLLISFLRSLLRFISTTLLFIPFLIAFSDVFKRAMHDFISQTIVIDVSIPQKIDE